MMKLTSKKLLTNLQALKSQYAGRTLTARLAVPPEMSWWYYQEFGTATGNPSGVSGFSENGASMQNIEASPNPTGYLIAPRTASYLAWSVSDNRRTDQEYLSSLFDYIEGSTGIRFNAVWHPGVTTPKAFVRRVLADIHTQASDTLALALKDNNYSFEALKLSMFEDVMPRVRDTIAASMQDSGIENTREQGGKLKGEPSAEFAAKAYVTEPA